MTPTRNFCICLYSLLYFPQCTLARSQVFRFLAEKILGRQDFCFYFMFKTIFSGHNTICGGTAPECPYVATGLSVPLSR